MSVPEVYCDTLGNIVVTGNIVRIELASLDPTSPDPKNPKLETRQRLIMPLDGFLRAFAMSQQVVTRLTEEGVLRQNPAAAASATATAATATPATATPATATPAAAARGPAPTKN
ncbi:MAG: hypothetical protein HQL57_00635 [Magnetococcales bacterium]|nr:hypothetical protein [Magnetococcales bacterium]MBF0155677.1 hypothetical protein [Magnetococcales bacterium]